MAKFCDAGKNKQNRKRYQIKILNEHLTPNRTKWILNENLFLNNSYRRRVPKPMKSEKHHKNVKTKSIYRCEIHKKDFANKSNLNRHIKTQHGNVQCFNGNTVRMSTRLYCPICDVCSQSNFNYKQHFITAHVGSSYAEPIQRNAVLGSPFKNEWIHIKRNNNKIWKQEYINE